VSHANESVVLNSLKYLESSSTFLFTSNTDKGENGVAPSNSDNIDQTLICVLGNLELIHSICLLIQSNSSNRLQSSAIMYLFDLYYKCLTVYLTLDTHNLSDNDHDNGSNNVVSLLNLLHRRFEQCYEVIVALSVGVTAIQSNLEKYIEYYSRILAKFDFSMMNDSNSNHDSYRTCCFKKFALVLQLAKVFILFCLSQGDLESYSAGLNLTRLVFQAFLNNFNAGNTELAMLLLILCDEIVVFVNKKYISTTSVNSDDSKALKRKRDESGNGDSQNSGDYNNLLKIHGLLLSELSTFSQYLNGILETMRLGRGDSDNAVVSRGEVHSNLIKCDQIVTEILEKISLALLHKSYQNIIYSSVTVFLNILKSLFHRCEFYHNFLNSIRSKNGQDVLASSISLGNLHGSLQDIYGVSIPRIILNIAKNPLNPSLSLSCHLLIACIESFAMRQHLVTEGMRFAQFGLIDTFYAVGGSSGRNSKKNTKHFVIKHLSPIGQIYFKDILINYSNEYKFIGKS
jgi:hypothetical protein